MTPEELTRLATLEQEMRDVRQDVSEIKTSLKALEKIASTGSGGFHAVLLLGGFIGWLIGVGVALAALFKH